MSGGEGTSKGGGGKGRGVERTGSPGSTLAPPPVTCAQKNSPVAEEGKHRADL